MKESDVAGVGRGLGVPGGRESGLKFGNVGEKQGMEKGIDEAERVGDRPLIVAIVGQGCGKARLENMTRDRGLANIKFRLPQPYGAFPARVKIGDRHPLLLTRAAAGVLVPANMHVIETVRRNAGEKSC